ncbi:unnamed protein product [Phytomonas sp. EM1]|nr:unnamed protein product [Phytomonas sp. EM1]|eukprot:CCW65700.1 unnamed protein product [Phytomonas sp. isolate EM1]
MNAKIFSLFRPFYSINIPKRRGKARFERTQSFMWCTNDLDGSCILLLFKEVKYMSEFMHALKPIGIVFKSNLRLMYPLFTSSSLSSLRLGFSPDILTHPFKKPKGLLYP